MRTPQPLDHPFGVMRAPRELIFGDGHRAVLGEVVAPLGRKALVCTDRRFAASAAMDGMRANLAEKGIEARVFDGTLAELPSDSIHACVEQCRGFAPDMVIGVGGGSCMDMAKLVALLLTHGGPLERYYGEFKVPGPVLPVIALPTTAGTGSEVTPVAVLADSARDLKVGISSPWLIPYAAICDPELTHTCPPALTALSGADALTHAIEAFTAIRHPADPLIAHQRVFVGRNVFSDHHALEAIRAIFGYLERAVAEPGDAQARSQLMYGSVCAGLAFGAAGTAAAHAIQYPVGALTHTPHGLGVAALLPYVMRFNASACEAELARIGATIGVAGSPQARAHAAIERTQALCASIGIPRTLADLGLRRDQLDWVAEQSMLAARLINNNPRPLTLDHVKTLVRDAFEGVATDTRALA
ncbi:iron-containing alcohol dehydrogenase [Paraburkholderia acidisoli]|uniref:Iron-containing alcohol dehydrogenase n=2 Tax=Paraburkholderia acidisoli TaxID=2571748 RepID=A0A7Z2GS17_9BURK|nr:iron-containing alcohol dehydrogenase [Paraburkholderia acidisoli]